MNNNRYLIILLLALLILVVVYFLTKLYNKVEQFQGVEENLRNIITETPIETSTKPPTETPTFAPVSVGSNNISNKLNTLSDKINTISDKINTIADHSTVQITSKSPTDMMSSIESIINNVIDE
jgi:hypothetical protein